MARLIYEGKTKVHFVPTISNIAAPTMVQISAGTNLTPFLSKDGLSVPNSTNAVDSATLDETFDSQLPGSWGGSISLTLFRDDATDAAWDLFVYGLAGHIVVSRFGTIAVASKVEVYPGAAHEPALQPTAANEQQRFVVEWLVSRQPNKRAVVA